MRLPAVLASITPTARIKGQALPVHEKFTATFDAVTALAAVENVALCLL
jgi:hypothetical protein